MTTSTYLFVYGTLRPGGALDDLTPGNRVDIGYIPGKLYRHQAARFPVLDLTPPAAGGTGLVYGDIYEVPVAQSERLDFLIDMECQAGYDARIRPVRRLASGEEVPCLLFAWPDRLPVGPRIYGGDWLSDEARDACADLNAGAGFGPRKK